MDGGEQKKDGGYRIRYMPVQAYALLKNVDGWTQEFSPIFGSCMPHCALVINEYGDLEAIGPYVMPNEHDIKFIPAQPGTYAVVEESDNGRCVVGYMSREYMPVMDLEGTGTGGERYTYYEADVIEGKKKTRVCAECRRVYESTDPNFCVKCGSPKIERRRVNSEIFKRTANVKVSDKR